MAQTVLITLTTAGLATGPFDLYSNVDGYITPFETGITRASLLSGYTSTIVPDTAFTIRVKSVNDICNNYTDLTIVTSTTTTTSSTSTTTTSSSTTSTTTTAHTTYSYYFADKYACPGCGIVSSVIVAVANPHTLTIAKYYLQVGVITPSECYKITGIGASAGPYPIMDYVTPFNSCAFACSVS